MSSLEMADLSAVELAVDQTTEEPTCKLFLAKTTASKKIERPPTLLADLEQASPPNNYISPSNPSTTNNRVEARAQRRPRPIVLSLIRGSEAKHISNWMPR